jgi:hypothetical protein
MVALNGNMDGRWYRMRTMRHIGDESHRTFVGAHVKLVALDCPGRLIDPRNERE